MPVSVKIHNFYCSPEPSFANQLGHSATQKKTIVPPQLYLQPALGISLYSHTWILQYLNSIPILSAKTWLFRNQN